MSVLDDFLKALKAIPRDPIAPANRRVARLFPTAYVVEGSVFRLAPQPDIVGHNHPLIVMNRDDVAVLRAQFREGPRGEGLAVALDVDQEIADCCEQLFADREARR
jgi:hypothetical protein